MKSDQQTRVPVTPGAMETLRLPADVHLSPGGQRIAYIVLEPVSDQLERQGRIWVVDTAGGEPQPLTKGPGDDSCPRWSLDNKQLAFISVDVNRVAIAGGSYGGFMAAWAITQTTLFKAAIMVVGVSDFHSFHAQSRIFDWDIRMLGGSPLEHPELYRERSAITYAARVKTPTLIIHGENDQDVPINQSHAFYRVLRERNVPVEFVIYPRESHSFIEREHRKDCEERILSWFERYL